MTHFRLSLDFCPSLSDFPINFLGRLLSSSMRIGFLTTE